MRPLSLLLALLVACDQPVIPPPVTGPGGTGTDCVDANADGICDPTATGDCSEANGGDLDEDGICGDFDDDDDGDGCPDEIDALPSQFSLDGDADGVADHCDPCPNDNPDDTDGDTVCDSDDQCAGDDTADRDGDGAPDDCDVCPDDALDDSDGDLVCDSDDLCQGHADGFDVDGDGVPDGCDPCPGEYPNDSDGDGVCDSVDICPGSADSIDIDIDGVPDGCDACPFDNPNDTDGDGVCDTNDICPGYVDGALDADNDGWTVAAGDCDDCNPDLGPQMFDVPASLIDEDCDGIVDNPPAICDIGLPLSSLDPIQAAAALDICDQSPPNGYGLVSARYLRASGASHPNPAAQVGLLDNFGNINIQSGDRMLGLSTGFARDATDPGTCGSISCGTVGPGTAPAGFPQNVPGCAGLTDIHDDVALELELQAPMNAVGFRMRFYFLSHEFPEYVCTSFNDQFIIQMDPAPVGAINGNIAVDSLGNPVSVNLAFMEVCDPNAWPDFATYCLSGCPPLPSPYCPLGPNELGGTGFDVLDTAFGEDGGTGWLEVTAPVTPGQIFTLDLAIWDTGDNSWDSTVLLDHFEWEVDPVTVGVQPQ